MADISGESRRGMSAKRVFSILVLIILGAAGSGLWEIAKPVFPWVRDIVLTTATLGINRLRDDLYLDVAKTVYSPDATETLNCLVGAILGLILGTVVALWLSGSYLEKPHGLVRKTIDRSYFYKRQVILVGSSVLLVLTAASWFSAYRSLYITQASAYLIRSQDIIAPFITEDRRLKLRSEIALIENRDDFMRIVGSMRKIASDNHLRFPGFAAF